MSGAPVTLVDTSNNAVSMATAAKQPALGTAGTASADVLTVQGITSGTPLIVDQTKQSSMINVPTTASFARPADTTAYTIGDLIANSVTAGSVTPLSWTGATISGAGGTGEITDVRIASGIGAGTVRVHFYTASLTVSGGDNAALVISSGSLANYVGFADVVLANPGSFAESGNGATGYTGKLGLTYKLASTDTLYAFLQAQTAITPASAASLFVVPTFRRYS